MTIIYMYIYIYYWPIADDYYRSTCVGLLIISVIGKHVLNTYSSSNMIDLSIRATFCYTVPFHKVYSDVDL